MKRAKMTIWVMVVLAVSFICLSQNAIAIIYDDGGEHIIDFAIPGNVEVRNVDTHVILVDGGSIGGYLRTEYVIGGGQATILGGSIGGGIQAISSQPMLISGGIIQGGFGLDAPSIDGDVTLIGNDFEVDGIPVPYGRLDGSIRNGRITGTLLSGDFFDNTFNLAGLNTFVFAPVPEPGTVLLLGLGAMMLRRRP